MNCLCHWMSTAQRPGPNLMLASRPKLATLHMTHLVVIVDCNHADHIAYFTNHLLAVSQLRQILLGQAVILRCGLFYTALLRSQYSL